MVIITHKNITFAILIAWQVLIFLIPMMVNALIFRQVEPPRMDTYSKIGDWVFACDLYKEIEWNENIRLAQFLGEKSKDIVYVLPHIQPTLRNAAVIRKDFFPIGVRQNKNPDYFFRGRFVDGKSMNDTNPENRKTAKRAIQNRLRNAFLQADDAFLEIPITFPLGWIEGAIKGKLKSSKNRPNII